MSDEEKECPLCLEPMELDDLAFFPCDCEYQICRFCWTKIRNEENGLCPACRKTYSDKPVMNMHSLPIGNDLKSRNRKKRKDQQPQPQQQNQQQQSQQQQQQQKLKPVSEVMKSLPELRVVQPNLIFVIGLPLWLSKEKEQLRGPDYFGQYGRVFKVEINQNQTFSGPQGQGSVSAYVTYHKTEDAMRAISDLDQRIIHGKQWRVSLGTTKYCSQFLRGAKCTKHECMYLHELGDQDASFTKEQMQAGRHTEYMNRLLKEYADSLSTPSPVETAGNNNGKVAKPVEAVAMATTPWSGKPPGKMTAAAAAAAAAANAATNTNSNNLESSSASSTNNNTSSNNNNNNNNNSNSKQYNNQQLHHHPQPHQQPQPMRKQFNNNNNNNNGEAGGQLHHEVASYGLDHFHQNNHQYLGGVGVGVGVGQVDDCLDIDFDLFSLSQNGLAKLVAEESETENSSQHAVAMATQGQAPIGTSWLMQTRIAPPPGFEEKQKNLVGAAPGTNRPQLTAAAAAATANTTTSATTNGIYPPGLVNRTNGSPVASNITTASTTHQPLLPPPTDQRLAKAFAVAYATFTMALENDGSGLNLGNTTPTAAAIAAAAAAAAQQSSVAGAAVSSSSSSSLLPTASAVSSTGGSNNTSSNSNANSTSGNNQLPIDLSSLFSQFYQAFQNSRTPNQSSAQSPLPPPPPPPPPLLPSLTDQTSWNLHPGRRMPNGVHYNNNNNNNNNNNTSNFNRQQMIMSSNKANEDGPNSHGDSGWPQNDPAIVSSYYSVKNSSMDLSRAPPSSSSSSAVAVAGGNGASEANLWRPSADDLTGAQSFSTAHNQNDFLQRLWRTSSSGNNGSASQSSYPFMSQTLDHGHRQQKTGMNGNATSTN